jgi:hypothetical protein
MPLNFKQQRPTITCEICGAVCLKDYSYSIAACWLVTGHAWIAGHMCSQVIGGQHWGCSPEHATEAMIACIQHDEHMSSDHLKQLHQEQADKGRSRVAEDDTDLNASDPEFHILSRGG